MVIRVMVAVAGVALCVAFWGARATYVGMHEKKQVEMSCADYVSHPPDASWVKLTGCEYDVDHLAYIFTGSEKKIRTVYIPLRPVGQTSGPAHIAVKRDDRVMIDVVEAFESKRTPPQGPLRTVTDQMSRPVEGFAASDFERDSRDKSELEKLDLGLAHDYVVIDWDGHPRLFAGICALVVGLVVLLLAGIALIRNWRRPRPPAPPPSAPWPRWPPPNPSSPLSQFERPM